MTIAPVNTPEAGPEQNPGRTRHAHTGACACHAARVAQHDYGKLDMLTEREREVLLLLGNGTATRHMAHQLGIAERTVKAHINRIIRKLGVQTRIDAAIISVLHHDQMCGLMPH